MNIERKLDQVILESNYHGLQSIFKSMIGLLYYIISNNPKNVVIDGNLDEHINVIYKELNDWLSGGGFED